MWEYALRALIGLLLFATAVQDLLTRKIKVWIVMLCALLICICIPFTSSLSLYDRIFGLVLGMGIVLLSRITKGKIGEGDGLVLCVTGLGLGFWCNLELFALALMIAAAFSIVLLILRLAGRKQSIPFIPFLFISYIFLLIPLWS